MSDETPHTDDFYVSTEDRLLDLHWVTNTLLATGWGRTWTHDMIAEAVKNSICFGLYEHRVAEGGAINKDRQRGFARIVTDYATVAWLADVVIDPEFRGRKLGKFLVSEILRHHDVARLPCLLRTASPEFYLRFGFADVVAMRRMPGV